MSQTPENLYEQVMLQNGAGGHAEPDGSNLKGGMFADSLKGQQEAARAIPSDIEVTIECTMKEFYCGSVHQIEFDRQEIHHVPKVSTLFKRTKQVEVKPGYSESTVLVFRGEGNQAYDQPTSNLVIKFKQTEHKSVTRVGDDLVMRVPVTLEDALRQRPVSFMTLDGRCLTVMPGSDVTPQSCVQVENEGMPGAKGRGRLFVKFDI